MTCPKCGCDELLTVTDLVDVCTQCGTCLDADGTPMLGAEDVISAGSRQGAAEETETTDDE